MGKKKTGRSIPTVEDVLSGRERLDAVELMRLIHRVNPTNDGLPTAEAALRYREKASLQSLLVRHHGQSLVVASTGEGVVSIRHAHFDVDGCHAVVGEFDEDARSLVQWHLDTGPSAQTPSAPAAPTRRPNPGDAGTDLSTQGRRALEEYDYDEARSCFEAAWRAAGPSAAEDALRDLLELLVDHLADYEAALSLPVPAAVRDDSTRLLLGRAAVRLGRADHAEMHLRGIASSTAADTLAELAELHLAAGDSTAAKRAVDRIAEAIPRHTAHADLERRTATLASAGRRSGEREAELAFQAGDEDRAEELCRALVAEHGSSAVARRILAELEGRRARRHAEALREEALRAQAEGDDEGALRRFVRARELAPGDEAIRTLAHEAAERCAAQRRAEDRRRAERALQGDDARAGLLAWAALCTADRTLVAVPSPRREWLEHALGRRQPADAVDAVLALEQALARPDPRAAARLIAPHRNALEGVSAVTKLDAAAAQEEQRVATARGIAALEATEAALARWEAAPDDRPRPDQLQEVEAQLREAARAPLPADARARLEAVRLWADRITRVVELDQQARHLSAQGRDVEAREALDEALRLLPAPGRAARRAALEAGICEAWALRWDPPDDVDLVDADFRGGSDANGDQLSEDLSRAYFLTVHGSWAFVREVAVPSGTVTRALRLKFPADHEYPSLRLHGSTMTLAARLFVVDVDLDSGAITRHVDVAALFGEQARHDEAVLPDPRHLVLTARPGTPGTQTHFIDLAKRRVERTTADLDFAYLLVTEEGTRVALANFGDEILVVDPRGRPAPGRIICPCNVSDVQPSPRGDGLLLVECDDDEGVTLFEIDEAGGPRGDLPLPEAYELYEAASARADELTALILMGDGERELVVVEATGPGPSVVWRTEVPRDTTLLRTSSRSHVTALVQGADGPVFIPIDRTLPTGLPGQAELFELPMLYVLLMRCDTPGGERGEACHEGRPQSTPAMLEEEIDGHIDAGRVSEALDCAAARPVGAGMYWARSMRQRIADRWPQHPEVAMRVAQDALEACRGVEAPELLTSVDLETVHVDMRRHFLHLRGLGKFQCGDQLGARSDWTDAKTWSGACNIDALVASLGPEGQSPGTRTAPRPECGAVLHFGDLCAILAEADRLRDAGDLEGARAALHRRAIWHVREEQTAGRLAAVHMDLHAATGRYAFATALACARLVHVDDALERERNLPVANRWDADRIRDVRRRAHEWLFAPPS